MTIFIKNKHTLEVGEFKFRCCIGKKGSTMNKKEGDKKTPKGTFKIENLYFRKDRLEKPSTSLKCIEIKKNMGWCDDPRSKNYNQLIKYPFNFKSEKLFRSDNIYDIILVLNFNMNPIRKNKGSAIFLHVANKKYSSTKGCVAISKIELKKLIKLLSYNSKIIIA